MIVYLVGYMYSGKTTVGRQLAARLGYAFVDLDQLFEERYHTTIPIFFSRYGEQAFRTIEQQLLHSTEGMTNTVISTGGGTPCHFDNMEWINAHGISIYLDTPVETILRRAATSRKVRPILANKSEEERSAFIQNQIHQRLPFYTQAKVSYHSNAPIEDFIIALQNKCLG